VVWTYVALVGSRVLAFASMIVLARMITPSAFGQLGFALLVISYLDALGDLGAGSALIYYQKNGDEAAQVAFRINLVTGLIWWITVSLLAPYAADFFRDEAVVPLLRTLAFIFPIAALGNTHDALLRKNLSFGMRLVPDYARALLKAILAIALAWQGFGVWSLVWGQLAGAAAWTLALWIVTKWRPAFHTKLTLAFSMLRYGCHIVSVNVLSTLVHHLDLLIVGRILGSTALGFYTLASRIPEVCITMLTWAVDTVAFPSYSKIQNDPAALEHAFRSTLRYVSIVTMPVGLVLIFTAKLLVPLAYGAQWLPAAPVVAGLTFAAVLRSLSSHAGNIFKAIGRPYLLTQIGAIRAIILVPALIFGAKFGITGVSMAQAVITGASTMVTLVIAARILEIKAVICLKELRPALMGTLGMGLVLGVAHFLADGWPPEAVLGTTLGAGLMGYAGALYIGSPEIIRHIGAGIASVLGRSA